MVNKLMLRLFTWIIWLQFRWGLKSVLGHKSLASAHKELFSLDIDIRTTNCLNGKELVTWSNSSRTPREIFARYVTLKELTQIGEVIVMFRAMQYRKILTAQED